MMDYVRFDEVTEGMMNNADDETIDNFLDVANKVAKLLKTKVDNLFIIPNADAYEVSEGTPVPTKRITSKLFDNGTYIVEKVNGDYWLYFNSEKDAEDFINSSAESLEENLVGESYGYKEKEVHDYLSAVRFAKQHDGRITGPKIGENGLKVFKVVYKESLSEDYDHDWNQEEYEDEVNNAYDSIYDSYYFEIIDYAIDNVAGRDLIEEALTETTDEEALKLISDYIAENNIRGLDKLSKSELMNMVAELDLDDIVRDYVSGTMDFDDDFRYACVDGYVDYAQIDFDDYMR